MNSIRPDDPITGADPGGPGHSPGRARTIIELTFALVLLITACAVGRLIADPDPLLAACAATGGLSAYALRSYLTHP